MVPFSRAVDFNVARAAIACVVLLFLGGCACLTRCLPAPTTDGTPPGAAVVVNYREPGGERVSRTVGVGDPDITVTADKDDAVKIILYSGGDDQGMRHVKLVYDMRYNTGTTVVQPLLAPIEVTLTCPKKLLAGSHDFAPDGHPWRYEFTTRSENWMGLTASSGKVTVRTQ